MDTLYGIIGYPLAHSWSPAYFSQKFAALGIPAEYRAYPLQRIQDVTGLLRDKPLLRGLNVTVPYKESVIPYLDKLSTGAQSIGAVNCIVVHNGVKTGYNTDAAGFEQSLLPLLQPQHRAALVLGTGGSAKAVCFVLQKLGITYQLVSRKPGIKSIAYADVTAGVVAAHGLIINTTPAGMYPNTEDCPAIPYGALTPMHLLYDLIYNPSETLFLKKGLLQGARIKNGHEMLLLQAEESWKLWCGMEE